jgi:hypothetical protein
VAARLDNAVESTMQAVMARKAETRLKEQQAAALLVVRCSRAARGSPRRGQRRSNSHART